METKQVNERQGTPATVTIPGEGNHERIGLVDPPSLLRIPVGRHQPRHASLNLFVLVDEEVLLLETPVAQFSFPQLVLDTADRAQPTFGDQ